MPCLPILICCSVLAVGSLADPSFAQARPPTDVALLAVPHERFTLPNGLVVILAPDNALPLVEVNLWYRVGSKDEAPGRSGFAHLFEHLMFMGTERVPDFDLVMEAGGGANNATTSTDRTNYFAGGPAELLPLLLWLEADRMADIGRCMTQEKLDLQREVVRNERRQNGENTPYGVADLRLTGFLHPPGHPYHESVIGSHEDLQAATVQDVRDFFARFYVPDNASLCVAGDFDPAATRALIEQLFGHLQPGSPRAAVTVAPGALERSREVVFTDAVQFPRVSYLWHSPALYKPGDAELDLLAGVLAGGRDGRLYRRLVVEEQLAVDVAAYQASALLGSRFQIELYAVPGADLARLRAAADEELAALLADGPTEAEVSRAVAGLETSAVAGLQSLRARADALNRYQMHFGDPDGFERDLQRYRRATPQSVTGWARQVLDFERRLIAIVLPHESAPERDPLDAGPPESKPARVFTPPVPEVVLRESGLETWRAERPGLPLVELTLLLPGGRLAEGANHAGLAALLAALMQEGAGVRDGQAFASALAALGAELQIRAELRSVAVSLRVLSRNLEAALELFADAVAHPRFAPEDFLRVQRLAGESLRQAEDDPGTLARQVSLAAWFGEDHPYGRPAGGWPETLQSAQLGDVRALHAAHLRSQGALLAAVGDLPAPVWERVVLRLEALLDRDGSPLPAQPVPQAQPSGDTRVLLVDRPGAPQTVVRWLMPGHAGGDARRLSFDLLNTLLGGSFTSRLNRNLRETHGYTYGAGSGWFRQPEQGLLLASSAVRADVTGAALAEFLAEFERLAQGDVSEAEAASARATVSSQVVAGFETLGGALRAWLDARERGEPPAALREDAAVLATLDAATLNRHATRMLPAQGRLLVLVGDAAQVSAQLAGLSLPAPVIVDSRGRPVASALEGAR